MTTATDNVNGHAPTSHTTPQDFIQQEYDYVICGGGTAGLTIAARLTENPNVTVGVIEAGKERLNDPLVDTPALFTQLLGNPEYDWVYKTTPQVGNNKHSVHHLPRGKLLGGSSGINYMMYVRGSDADYDDWAALADDESWSSTNMKQYMRKHQTLEPIDAKVTNRSTMPFVGENHGTSGPIRTSFNPWKLPIEDDVIQAADQAAGFSKKPIDPWSGDHIGFYHTLGAIARTGPQKGKRSYAARGYYEALGNRPNLKVVTESLVRNVVLDGNTATGAVFRHNGQNYTVKAKREVIVCGGAINSPQILELSGIGDPKVLEAAGVDCKIANPGVGNNFQDHVVSLVSYETADGVPTLDSIANPEVLQHAMKAWQEEQTGPLTCASTVQGFFPYTLFSTEEEQEETIKNIEDTKDQTEFAKKQRKTIVAHLKNPQSANLQFVAVAAGANCEDGHAMQSKIFPPLEDPSAPNRIALAVCMQYPTSRGYVHIKSSDPEQHPEINPAYLETSADVSVLAAGMKFLNAVANAPALKGKLGRRLFPGPHRDLSTIEGSREAVKDWYMGEYHACGSCAMGDVLDSRLRVKGARNLRVADASIFPGNVSGNIMSTVYSLAEKAADLIKTDWDYAPLKNGA